MRVIIAFHSSDLVTIRSARGLRLAVGNLQRIAHPSSLTNYSRLNKLLELAAIQAHATDRDEDAIGYIRDMGFISDACMDELRLIAFGAAGNMRGSQAHLLLSFHNELCLRPRSEYGANPAEVRALISELVDDRQTLNVFVRSWTAYRALELKSWEDLAAARLESASLRKLMMPMFQFTALRRARNLNESIAAGHSDRYPSARHLLTIRPTDYSESIVQSLATGGYETDTSKYLGAFEHRFRVLLLRRAAAIALAIRLYESDHDDKPPQTLAELVPNYLPAIPDDPFAPAPRPLQYRPNREPPVIYSVGENGIDDGGVLTGAKGFPDVDWGAPDYVVPLRPSKSAPASPPATRANPTPRYRNPFIRLK